MSRILAVDDELRYCDLLRNGLSDDGNEARTATRPREALEVATRFRPQVLVTDWMLGDDANGLAVAAAMRTIVPQLRTVLITGFPSPGLRREAEAAQVWDFVEKPFDLGRIRAAVQRAASAQGSSDPGLPIGVLDLDDDGSLLFANQVASEFLADTRVGQGRASWLELVDLEPGEAAARWRELPARFDRPSGWQVCSRRRLDWNGYLVVVLAAENERYMHHEHVKMLLGTPETETAIWPHQSHVLIVDDYEPIRRAAAEVLRSTGFVCHTAESGEAALQLFASDRKIQIVMLDYEIPGTVVAELVERLMGIRPSVTIVGNSGTGHKDEFAAMGVTHFLTKPFSAREFVDSVSARVGRCVGCGSPVSLRLPRGNEVLSSWACRTCGTRYSAVLDDTCLSGVLEKVQLEEPA